MIIYVICNWVCDCLFESGIIGNEKDKIKVTYLLVKDNSKNGSVSQTIWLTSFTSLHISGLCVVYLCIFIYFTSCPLVLFRSKFFIVYSNSFFSGNSTEMVKTDVAYCRVKDNWWIMHCIKSYKLKRDVKLVDLPIMSNTKRC